MFRQILAISSAIIAFSVPAKASAGNWIWRWLNGQFGGIEAELDELRARVEALEERPGGPPGFPGAGNIAFTDFIGSNSVLLANGEVWAFACEGRTGAEWARGDCNDVGTIKWDPPIPLQDIVEWSKSRLLDVDGNVLRVKFLPEVQADQWVNIAHP